MKKIILSLLLTMLAHHLVAQKVDGEVQLKDLAVPNSPSFVLVDASPSAIQTPNTPKAFILGLAQSFETTNGFPQNYSAEFAPYWWFKPSDRSVYTLLGLKTGRDSASNITSVVGENPFSGLKFTSFSVGFLTKDLIPDTIRSDQKIFSIGIRTTVIKIHGESYQTNLKSKIKAWHDKALMEIAILQEVITRDTSPVSLKRDEMLKELANYKPKSTSQELKEINDLMNEKPIFSLDVAGAYATYGINDSAWKSGRSGIWTTLSSYIPLDSKETKPHKNYFNFNFALRYLVDNYAEDEEGLIKKVNSVDIGGKIMFELDQLSIGAESMYRYSEGIADTKNRTVGIINYRIANNIYLNGAFGKNFDLPNKLIAIFGINWGLGSETTTLPSTK